jgi:hypothetical protein
MSGAVEGETGAVLAALLHGNPEAREVRDAAPARLGARRGLSRRRVDLPTGYM